MTFCFAKAVTFDVNVNVGAASLSNVKSKAKKTLLSPEWYFATDAHGADKALLRIQKESEAVKDADAYWSKDGGTTWFKSAADDEHKKEYRDYVTSVAKDYALEKDYERHHYEYKDSIRNQKGGFAAGLDVGVRYELTPCVKIGARAFFTATNLKQDVSYTAIPVDKNGNFASATAQNEREVQMLIGYANKSAAAAAAGGVQIDEAATTYYDDFNVTNAGAKIKIAHANDKTGANQHDKVIAMYALNVNRKGYEALKKLEKNADGKYEYTFSAALGVADPIVLTSANLQVAAAALVTADTWNQLNTKLISYSAQTNAATNEMLRTKNYHKISRVETELPTVGGNAAFADAHETASICNLTKAVNITNAEGRAIVPTTTTGNTAIVDDINKVGIKLATIANGDKLVLSEEKYNEIMQAFEEMSADFDRTVIDQTLKVKNVWGGMVTLSWNATDCTLFTLGLGVGVPSVSKIDNLKKKVGFAGMFEVSTKIADSFSVGLRYQYNRINLKEKDCDSAVHHLSKVNGNLHVFSANFTYAF